MPTGQTVTRRDTRVRDAHASEVAQGRRFEFGKNWQRFLSVLNEDRIRQAETSLRNMLRVDNLEGRSFLDIGSGSGLFSLAAMRLGPSRVHSFDYDPHSVACTQELKRRYFPQVSFWTVEAGSALDRNYLAGLGKFDVVYSWGVLHHTGNMWQALDNVVPLVAPGGKLFIAIYNYQGNTSRRWARVKRLYNQSAAWRCLILAAFIPYFAAFNFASDVVHVRNPFARYHSRSVARGMSYLRDWVDWLGGYPFEVATPEQIVDFYTERGFSLRKLRTCGGSMGCNEYVFVRQ